MKNFRIGLIAALVFVASLGAAALAQTSNPSNCTLSGCQQSWTQNGIQSFVRTYKYSSLGNTPAATPTDLFTIAGAAGKTIRITKIVIGGAATTAGQLNPLIIRRSVVDTGGTSTNPAAQSRDINNVAAAATLTLYTVSPTGLGTTVGTLDSCRLYLQVAATGAPDVCAFTYGVNDDQLLVLRGATDVLALNFAGATVPTAGTIDIDVEWTEEP
jgi:hypothetical protein